MCDTLDRLSSSANRLAQLDAARADEATRHGELVAAARDDGCGHSWAAIAAAARRAPSSCHAIANEHT